jgi:hypothetical protein
VIRVFIFICWRLYYTQTKVKFAGREGGKEKGTGGLSDYQLFKYRHREGSLLPNVTLLVSYGIFTRLLFSTLRFRLTHPVLVTCFPLPRDLMYDGNYSLTFLCSSTKRETSQLNAADPKHASETGTYTSSAHLCVLCTNRIGTDGANWIRLAHDRVQWRAFVNAGYFLTSWVTISFSNNILHHGVSE